MTTPAEFVPHLDRLAQELDSVGAVSAGWERSRAGLATFCALVAEWNAKLDLTAARTPAAIAEILVADAIVLARRTVLPEGEIVLDVGTGAGGPALALALLREDLRLVLLEPKGKRVAFLRTVVGSTGLAGRVQVVEGRVEPKRPVAPPSSFGAFTTATSRATFEPPVWAATALALAPHALLLLAQEPIPQGLAVDVEERYALPSSRAPRSIVRVHAAG